MAVQFVAPGRANARGLSPLAGSLARRRKVLLLYSYMRMVVVITLSLLEISVVYCDIWQNGRNACED